jgi:cell shape-determining protein MreC
LAFPGAAQQLGATAAYPFASVAVFVRDLVGKLPFYLRERGELHAEIERLRAKLDQEGDWELAAERLLEENATLRSHFGEAASPRTLARVIARPPFLPYDLVQIDKGADHGISTGAPVFIGRDTVIGLISHAAATYSFVELVSSPGFTSTVYVVGPNIFTYLEGMGGGVARVSLPPDLGLHVGDLVILPAFDGGVYGRIVHVDGGPTQPEQFGYVASPLALKSLRYVTVGGAPTPAATAPEIENHIKEVLGRALVLDVPPPASTAPADNYQPHNDTGI